MGGEGEVEANPPCPEVGRFTWASEPRLNGMKEVFGLINDLMFIYVSMAYYFIEMSLNFCSFLFAKCF